MSSDLFQVAFHLYNSKEATTRERDRPPNPYPLSRGVALTLGCLGGPETLQRTEKEAVLKEAPPLKFLSVTWPINLVLLSSMSTGLHSRRGVKETHTHQTVTVHVLTLTSTAT